MRVPIAADGSVFSPRLARKSGLWVGEKGCEKRFERFDEALAYLRGMTVARWRRPNAAGAWGIVQAVAWVELDQNAERGPDLDGKDI